MQIFGAALQGLNAAESKLDRTAERISKTGTVQNGADSVDLASEMVNLMTAKEEYAANLKSLKAGDEMVKHTIDLLA